MTKQQVVAELARDGYQPFMRPFMGSVITAEAWASKARNKRMVIVLYRKDTEEIVDVHNLPADEEQRPDIDAFLDDFKENVFQAH